MPFNLDMNNDEHMGVAVGSLAAAALGALRGQNPVDSIIQGIAHGAGAYSNAMLGINKMKGDASQQDLENSRIQEMIDSSRASRAREDANQTFDQNYKTNVMAPYYNAETSKNVSEQTKNLQGVKDALAKRAQFQNLLTAYNGGPTQAAAQLPALPQGAFPVLQGYADDPTKGMDFLSGLIKKEVQAPAYKKGEKITYNKNGNEVTGFYTGDNPDGTPKLGGTVTSPQFKPKDPADVAKDEEKRQKQYYAFMDKRLAMRGALNFDAMTGQKNVNINSLKIDDYAEIGRQAKKYGMDPNDAYIGYGLPTPDRMPKGNPAMGASPGAAPGPVPPKAPTQAPAPAKTYGMGSDGTLVITPPRNVGVNTNDPKVQMAIKAGYSKQQIQDYLAGRR